MSGVRKVRGLAALVTDAVDGGSRAIERVQKRMAKRTFDVLEAIPVVAAPAQAVHVVHDAVVGVTHASIRVVSRTAAVAVDLALDAAERCYGDAQPGPTPHEPAPHAPAPHDAAPQPEPHEPR